MKSMLKIALLLLLPFFAKAQNQQKQLDSLHTALVIAENDTIKISVLYNLANYYAESNRDSALFFIEPALVISRQIKQPLWTARVLIDKSYLIQHQGNLPLAYRLTNEAMVIAKDAKNEKNSYIEKTNKFAANPHKHRLDILAGVYHMLGNQYSTAGNKEKAITYYKEEIQVSKEIGKEENLVNSNMNIGSIFSGLNKLDSARFYSYKALAYADNTGYKTYKGNILKDIGTIFFKNKQLDSAKHFFLQSVIVSRAQNNRASEIATNNSLAILYQSIRQPDSMLYYAKSALSIATNLKAALAITTSAKIISDGYKMMGNTDSAFAYISISKRLGDSVNTDRNQKLIQFQDINFEEQMRLEKTEQENIAYKNKIRTIALFSGLGLLSLLAFIFYRNNRQKQKANTALEKTLTDLKSTQSQLVQSEKMASLGELTAGIAHEIQNPLNFVNNFSEVNKELIEEMKAEIDKGNLEEVKTIANDIESNEEKINHHGKRADAIVKGMLQHSRSSSGVKEPIDINALCDEYLRLSYHGLRAKDKSFNATMKTDFDESIGKINIIPQDIGRVVLNLLTNGFYVVDEKKTLRQAQGDTLFEPTVSISTKKIADIVEIKVTDNGNGIPQKVLDKIFQPFFTTKPTGQGTGLGLSLSYDIIKAHGGELKVETRESEGTAFIIELPIT